jgi:hypothetical protein
MALDRSLLFPVTQNEPLLSTRLSSVTGADGVASMIEPGKRAVAALHEMALKDRCGHFGLILDCMNEAWVMARRRKQTLCDDTVIAAGARILNALKTRKELYA